MLVALLLFLVMVRSFLRREIGIYISELETFLSPSSEVEQKIGKEEETETVKSYLSDVVKKFPSFRHHLNIRVAFSFSICLFHFGFWYVWIHFGVFSCGASLPTNITYD